MIASTILCVLLVAVALFFGVDGWTSLTVATVGVGRIAIACFIAILARMAQASAHYHATKPRSAVEPETAPPPSGSGAMKPYGTE